MKTTTFKQIINGNTYTVTIPQTRVSTIMNRVDNLIFKNKFVKAFEVIEPFIGEAQEGTPVVATNTPETLIEANRVRGRRAVIAELMSKFNLNKAQAYYRARKAGI